MNRIRTATTITTVGIVVAMMAGCTPSTAESASEPSTAAEAAAPSVDELRLGYFANVTHAPALVGLEEGLFEDALGDVDLTTQVFNAGPAAI
ncbi:MAG TPA: sulfonate ABC transporter substrate-binding protein, partial [Microbacterium sp.]|nr:sulfonate ABC transporter substrate-binding protein [Microbacterium sp.]